MRLAIFLRICLLLVSVMACWQQIDLLEQVHLGQRVAHRLGAHFRRRMRRAPKVSRASRYSCSLSSWFCFSGVEPGSITM